MAWAAPEAYQQRPEWKYMQMLNESALSCQAKASSASTAIRYQSAQQSRYLDDLGACIRDASTAADAGLKGAISPKAKPPVKAAVKGMYTKWRTYLGTIDAYRGENVTARREFDNSINELRVELLTE